jgi:hypothetical protein
MNRVDIVKAIRNLNEQVPLLRQIKIKPIKVTNEKTEVLLKKFTYALLDLEYAYLLDETPDEIIDAFEGNITALNKYIEQYEKGVKNAQDGTNKNSKEDEQGESLTEQSESESNRNKGSDDKGVAEESDFFSDDDLQ